MKIILLLIFSLFNLVSYSQKWSLSPFIGNAVMVSGTDKGLQLPNSNDLYGLGFNYLKLNYHLMSPLTFGLKVNYKKDRLTYSTGLIFGDQSWSNVQFYTLGPKLENQIFTNTLFVRGSGTGLYNFKIPISVSYQFTKPLQRKNGVQVQLHTGLNISFYERWNANSFDADIMKKFTADDNDGWMILPYYFTSVNINNDVIDQVYWSANLNKGINLSFDLGLNFNWYIKVDIG
jgi:hypothetical protein